MCRNFVILLLLKDSFDLSNYCNEFYNNLKRKNVLQVLLFPMNSESSEIVLSLQWLLQQTQTKKLSLTLISQISFIKSAQIFQVHSVSEQIIKSFARPLLIRITQGLPEICSKINLQPYIIP